MSSFAVNHGEDLKMIQAGFICRLLFGVNEKLLTQHISGPITKYKLFYVSNQGRARHCHLLTLQNFGTISTED